MKENAVEWIVVGRFGRAHGVKGLISVHSFTEPRDNIFQYTDWYGLINGQYGLIQLSHVEINDKHILVQVSGYPQREDVIALTNTEIVIEKAVLPALNAGEYYWHDLMGMSVINTQEQRLGQVIDILATGSNDVLVVMGEKKHLIPYLPEQTVLKVDPVEKTIMVDWDMDF